MLWISTTLLAVLCEAFGGNFGCSRFWSLGNSTELCPKLFCATPDLEALRATRSWGLDAPRAAGPGPILDEEPEEDVPEGLADVGDEGLDVLRGLDADDRPDGRTASAACTLGARGRLRRWLDDEVVSGVGCDEDDIVKVGLVCHRRSRHHRLELLV